MSGLNKLQACMLVQPHTGTGSAIMAVIDGLKSEFHLVVSAVAGSVTVISDLGQLNIEIGPAEQRLMCERTNGASCRALPRFFRRVRVRRRRGSGEAAGRVHKASPPYRSGKPLVSQSGLVNGSSSAHSPCRSFQIDEMSSIPSVSTCWGRSCTKGSV